MTYLEIAAAFGIRNARRLHDFQTRFEAEVIAHLRETEARPRKPRRRRPPEWCLPPWERRDGNSHVVWTTTTRSLRRNAKGITGYWLFEDGKPRFFCGDKDWRASAGFAATHRDILLWAVEDWEAEKAANPQIDEILKAYNRKEKRHE